MTYIEFYDKTATENICACLTLKPDRVMLVGRDRKDMEKSVESYRSVLKARGMDTEFIIKSINPNNLYKAVDFLEDTVSLYDNCVFDLTGGDDIYLVACGIVFERHKDKKLGLIRFNIHTGTVQDCDGDNEPEFPPVPSLGIEENITIYGGRVLYSDKGSGATYKWRITDELRCDIEKIWKLCKKDVKRWNSLISILDATDKIGNKNAVEDEASITLLSSYTERLVTRSSFDIETVEALKKEGLILSYRFDGQKFKVKYKNPEIKKCLTKAGQALEMKIYITALDACTDDGEKVYNDVMTGINITWDSGKGIMTENEIDVMMMKGLIPVFVSCKNGFVETDELYKLNTVAEKFGGEYAKKVLIASALDIDSSFGKILKARADEMGIRIISDDLTAMSDSELNRKVRSFWSN